MPRSMQSQARRSVAGYFRAGQWAAHGRLSGCVQLPQGRLHMLSDVAAWRSSCLPLEKLMVAMMQHPAVTSCTDISVQLVVLSPSHRSLAPCEGSSALTASLCESERWRLYTWTSSSKQSQYHCLKKAKDTRFCMMHVRTVLLSRSLSSITSCHLHKHSTHQASTDYTSLFLQWLADLQIPTSLKEWMHIFISVKQ